MDERRHGFAVPVVLLVGAVILVSVVTAASVAALGSRINVADEKVSYQALLAAESGINTFAARARAKPYGRPFDEESFQAYLDTFGGYTMPNGFRVELQTTLIDDTRFTLTSTATQAEDEKRAFSRVRQDFSISAAAAEREVIPPAGLISIPRITLSSNSAYVYGLTDSKEAWTFQVPFERAMPGDYVAYQGALYRVGEERTLRPVPDGETADAPAPTTVVEVRPYAVAQAVASVEDGVSTFTVTDGSLYQAKDTLKIDTVSGATLTGEVVSVEGDLLTVRWTQGEPSSLDGIPEGAVVRRVVNGAVSETGYGGTKLKNIIPPGSTTLPTADLPSGSSRDPATGEIGSRMFAAIFGVDPLDFKHSLIAGDIAGGTYVADPASAYELNDDVLWLDNPSGQTVFCGSGIVIIDASKLGNEQWTLNKSLCGPFWGVVYVLGGFRIQGNVDAEIHGSVIVEGPLQIDGQEVSFGNDDDTNVGGKGVKVQYDPLAVREATRHIPDARIVAVGEPIKGTWRQGP